MATLGDQRPDETLTFRPQVVNRKRRKEIDHRVSEHIYGVQKGEFLKVNCDR